MEKERCQKRKFDPQIFHFRKIVNISFVQSGLGALLHSRVLPFSTCNTSRPYQHFLPRVFMKRPRNLKPPRIQNSQALAWLFPFALSVLQADIPLNALADFIQRRFPKGFAADINPKAGRQFRRGPLAGAG